MTDPSRGHVVDIQPKGNSRRELLVTTGLTGTTRITLMPGVLGTEDGQTVVALASDLAGIYLGDSRRNRPRRKSTQSG